MRNTLLATLIGAGLLASTVAFADNAQPGAPAQPVAANAPDRVVCHNYIHEGVLLRAGECHTQKEWDRIRYETQQSLSQWQTRSLMMPDR
jgi:hypothetical protein